MEIEKEIRELKRRMDLAETRLGQFDGSFEFVSGQLRDIELHMHARFEEVDRRFDAVDGRFDRVENRLESVEGKIDALPRVLAEMIGRTG